MSHRRLREVRSAATVWVNGARQRRPNLPSDMCPFCPGGREAPEPYTIRWFTNRWPALPDDRCEVILYTPAHDAALWQLGTPGARRVVDLWAERIVALGARDDVACVLPFENRGAEVGATISHPHGQIYGFDTVPPVVMAELSSPTCPICTLCAEPDADLQVSRHGGWLAMVPPAARYPFELLVAPIAHRPDLPSLDGDERDDLATVLVDSLARLDQLFAAPMPYMLWVHQRPTDGGRWPQAHVHVEIAPLYRAPGTPRFVAAAELASGVWLNPLEPAEAARRLRQTRR